MKKYFSLLPGALFSSFVSSVQSKRFIRLSKTLLFLLICTTISCQKNLDTKVLQAEDALNNVDRQNAAPIQCSAQAEQTDYNFYEMNSDGTRVGDVMPYYDASSGLFYIYYLKDIWNDATNQRHPWYGFTTTDFYSYNQIVAGEIIGCSTDPCKQDYAVGTGSVIKSGSTYYGFYTGHNPNYPSGCVTKKEGVMLATSTSPSIKFTKSSPFTTIYPPVGQGFDEGDNFRDPFVFLDNGTYYMLVSARKNASGTWRGVIVKYTSTNLTSWTYAGVLYDGGSTNYFMMECPEIFKIGSTYYLLFSDINTKNVYYIKCATVSGTWSYPVGPDRFDGTGIYAAKTATNGTDRYIFGWTAVNAGNNDAGLPIWGGNLVVHKIFQKANGDLSVCIPHTLKSNVETTNLPISKNSQYGNVTNTVPGSQTYRIISTANYDVANVLYDPISAARFKISATVSYTTSSRDFGFLIGACDGYDNVFSLRFVPSQNRFSFDKTKRSLITSSTVPSNDGPFTMAPNTNYAVQIVIENSMAVVYINNEVALTSRIYKATNTTWGVFADNSDATFTNITVTKP